MSNSRHHPAAMSPVEHRVAALEALLTERGLVPEGFIEQITRRAGPGAGRKATWQARPGGADYGQPHRQGDQAPSRKRRWPSSYVSRE
jgi:hypothetical protein